MTLGGGVDLAREPRDGRTFEYAGEDPLLAGTIVGNLMKCEQAQHVVGDIKHYAMNDQETGRNFVNAIISKRGMQESDLLAFHIGISIANPAAVMCSYNRVNGDYACENSYLLHDVLKAQWGFKGFVDSDWGGTHSTEKASAAGLDQEQPMGNTLAPSCAKLSTPAACRSLKLTITRAVFSMPSFSPASSTIRRKKAWLMCRRDWTWLSTSRKTASCF